MPLVPGQTTKHLRELRANPEMLAFLCGFDTPDGKPHLPSCVALTRLMKAPDVAWRRQATILAAVHAFTQRAIPARLSASYHDLVPGLPDFLYLDNHDHDSDTDAGLPT